LSNLRCDLFRPWEDDFKNGLCTAMIWELGGCINGSHQPYTVVDEINGSEIEVRQEVEDRYPGIQYRPIPRVIEGGLLE